MSTKIICDFKNKNNAVLIVEHIAAYHLVSSDGSKRDSCKEHLLDSLLDMIEPNRSYNSADITVSKL